ncbi:putative protein OS=Streptomyces griseomycini OX=66895 GN=FHS37_006502 PE=4 SV=1 [Streptomyces griseomycini]|uniref:Uncharacterized protein n=1 Tax=Streptomyces griseomycini TaxID=66895 RepID=A0A7W7PW34_9ACTN|nr:hypothetical protein [Streptomyces griseomycini]GGR45967.1 hypothetical protein GCM10015536_59710 [Streptomyces griseomycini]
MPDVREARGPDDVGDPVLDHVSVQELGAAAATTDEVTAVAGARAVPVEPFADVVPYDVGGTGPLQVLQRPVRGGEPHADTRLAHEHVEFPGGDEAGAVGEGLSDGGAPACHAPVGLRPCDHHN